MSSVLDSQQKSQLDFLRPLSANDSLAPSFVFILLKVLTIPVKSASTYRLLDLQFGYIAQ